MEETEAGDLEKGGATLAEKEEKISRDELMGTGLVKGLMTQISQLKSELDSVRSAEEEREARIKQEQAEKAGDWERARSELESSFSKKISALEEKIASREKRERDLLFGLELRKLGVAENRVAEAGLRALFDSQSEVSDPAEWLASMQESDEIKALMKPSQIAPPRDISVAGRGGNTADVAKLLASKNHLETQRGKQLLTELPEEKRSDVLALARDIVRGKK